MSLAQDPDRPLDDGKITLPKVDPGMNRIAPNNLRDSSDGKVEFLRAGDRDKAEEDEEILARARKRLERCIAAESDNRRDGLDDDKFYAGDQWPADVRARRNSEKRPCLTINKLPVLVKQVTNDQRQNRPTIDYHPVGDRGDVDVAKIFRGLVRDIERCSHADRAYDTGFESAARKGWGYWRIVTEYEDDDTFDQVIRVKRIRNAYSVYLDPDSSAIDGSDAKFGFITEMIDRDEFKAQYPDADPMPWVTGGYGDSLKNWIDQYAIRIAEYYETTHSPRELVMLDNGYEGWHDELNAETKERYSVVARRRVLVPKIMWYKITGKAIIERTRWLGQWIPIVKCIGDEIDIEGRVKLWGIVRQSKDSQRQYNYWRELACDTPIATVDGWTNMGNIKEGDRIFDETGSICTVLGTSPVYTDRRCFRITFDDNSNIVASDIHEWEVEEKQKDNNPGNHWKMRRLQTKELIPGKHFIYVTKPLELPKIDLPIHPYILGYWIGNGTVAEPQISCHQDDAEEIQGLFAEFGYSVGDIRPDKAPSKNIVFSILGVRKIFAEQKLLGDKRIDRAYMRASVEQRLLLLRGLMDSDGSVDGKPQCSFTTTNVNIADRFAELLYSLGIKACYCVREPRSSSTRAIIGRQFVYQFSFTAPSEMAVFALRRKKEIQTRPRNTHPRRNGRFKIKNVEEISSVPVRCIMVDSPSHLFLAGNAMVPTHNTSETERVALSPKAPYIIAEGQLEGYDNVWKEANNKSFPFLPYKATEIHGHMVPPPQRQPPVEVPAGVVSAAQNAAQDMLATTGIRFDSTLSERTYDESGRALRELGRRTDIGSFNYIDNLMHSLRHTGEIFVDLIPKIYKRPGRVLTILRDDDTDEQVRLNPGGQKPVIEQIDPNTQRIMRAFDPTYGHYGVAVTIGPSYATRRIETAESMMDFLRAIPQAAPYISDLVAKNQDWQGADEIATRLAKLLPPGLNQPEMRDVPPQVQALLAQLQQQLQKLTQERNQLMAQVNERDKDRELARERINRTFEVQLLQIVQKAQANAQKVQAEDKRSEAEGLRNLASDVLNLYGTLTKGTGENQNNTNQNSNSPNVSGVKQAPDGNWYVPDPNRQGKYLRVDQRSA